MATQSITEQFTSFCASQPRWHMLDFDLFPNFFRKFYQDPRYEKNIPDDTIDHDYDEIVSNLRTKPLMELLEWFRPTNIFQLKLSTYPTLKFIEDVLVYISQMSAGLGFMYGSFICDILTQNVSKNTTVKIMLCESDTDFFSKSKNKIIKEMVNQGFFMKHRDSDSGERIIFYRANADNTINIQFRIESDFLPDSDHYPLILDGFNLIVNNITALEEPCEEEDIAKIFNQLDSGEINYKGFVHPNKNKELSEIKRTIYDSEKKLTPEDKQILTNHLKKRETKSEVKQEDNNEDTEKDKKESSDDNSYLARIKRMKCNDHIKSKALEKLKESEHGHHSDVAKARKFLDALLQIPLGIYKKEPALEGLSNFQEKIQNIKSRFTDELIHSIISKNSYTSIGVEKLIQNISGSKDMLIEHLKKEYPSEKFEELSTVLFGLSDTWNEYKQTRREFMNHANQKLECIYGQQKAKQSIRHIFGQWVNGEMGNTVLGFQGPPGTGKTSLAKGIADCLVDENGHSRPFIFISLGGCSRGATLTGFHQTYVGSTWGKIADGLMGARCMNPVIYFDELDKVSQTEHGQEIIGILTHLIDPVQNCEFSDRYFDNIALDVSKALFIFSYNDADKIDRILKDRIIEIEFNPYTKAEKYNICKDYLIPNVCSCVGYNPEEIRFTDQAITHLIDSYIYEAGVRNLKQKLFQIIREINFRTITDESNRVQNESIIIQQELVDEILETKNIIDVLQIHQQPQIGYVNGLYATNLGVGGILPIQVSETLSDIRLSLELTGNLGKVLQESMRCARTVTWHYLPSETKIKLNQQWKDFGPFGLHIHMPSSATSKDGPSAGIGITTAIISFLTDRPVKNDIAMTGEIDLHGKVNKIGGLLAKIEGAMRAGVKTILIPKENHSDWEEICSQYEMINIIEVDHISQVLDICLL